MSKDGFVTNNLHRISDRIAEVAKKHEQELTEWKNQKKPSSPGSQQSDAAEEKEEIKPVSGSESVPAPEKITGSSSGAVQKKEEEKNGENIPARQKLSASTEAALLRHHEEALRLKRDLLMLMETVSASADEEYELTEKKLAELSGLKNALEEQKKEFLTLELPDREDYRYQMLLGDLYRKMDTLKISILRLKAKADRFSLSENRFRDTSNKQNLNFFAEMHSLKKRELFRTGFWIFFPVLLGLFLSSLLVGTALFLTFKTGL